MLTMQLTETRHTMIETLANEDI